MKKYILVLAVLFGMFSIAKTQNTWPERTKEDLKYFLNTIKMPEEYTPPNTGVNSFKREYYYDPEIKKRFLEVLANKWTEEELETWAEHNSKLWFDEKEKEKLAKRYAEKGKQAYERILDSLIQARKKMIKLRMLKEEEVSPIIIHFTGWLDMQEAVPILKEALNDPKHYDNWEVQLALARLKAEPYYTEILKKYSFIPKKYKNDETALSDYYKNINVLTYLGTQESIYAISDWLYRKEMVSPIYDVENYTISIANYPVRTFTQIIKNEDFKKRFPESLMMNEVTKEDIEFCKKWFKKNKGKLEFNRY